MMKILFQGKRKDTGEWVQGDFCRPCNIIWEEIGHDEALGQDGVLVYNDSPVIPETVGQYVRDDVNGKPAFVGSIIKELLGDTIGVIRFGEYRQAWGDDEHTTHVGFYVEWLGGTIHASMLRKDVGYWLNLVPVIGNIHDHPELLNPAPDAADPADNGAIMPAT